MANTRPPRAGASSEVATPAPQDLFATSDIRFVTVRIGELSTKVARLIDDVARQGEKIVGVRHQISSLRGALWVIGFVIAAMGAAAAWYLSGKIAITLH